MIDRRPVLTTTEPNQPTSGPTYALTSGQPLSAPLHRDRGRNMPIHSFNRTSVANWFSEQVPLSQQFSAGAVTINLQTIRKKGDDFVLLIPKTGSYLNSF